MGSAGVLLKSTPGRLYSLTVVNTAATAYVVMIFDKASAPVANDVPIWRRRLAASSEVVIDLKEFGLFCSLGIGFAISTAAAFDALTLGADDVHYSAEYR